MDKQKTKPEGQQQAESDNNGQPQGRAETNSCYDKQTVKQHQANSLKETRMVLTYTVKSGIVKG